MTENKRYSMKGSTILENGEEITAWDCCDLLNELHSNVIYQRQNVDKLTQKNSELEYENKELKVTISELEDYNEKLFEDKTEWQIKLQKIRDYAMENGEVKQDVIEKVVFE